MTAVELVAAKIREGRSTLIGRYYVAADPNERETYAIEILKLVADAFENCDDITLDRAAHTIRKDLHNAGWRDRPEPIQSHPDGWGPRDPWLEESHPR